MVPPMLTGNARGEAPDAGSPATPRNDTSAAADEAAAAPTMFAALMPAASSTPDADPPTMVARPTRRPSAAVGGPDAGCDAVGADVLSLQPPVPLRSATTTPATVTESATETADPAATAAGRRAAPFDLPAFLQTLPRAGLGAAVAAGREPPLAEAVRRLGPPADPVTRRAAPVGERALRLPSFLMEGAAASTPPSHEPAGAKTFSLPSAMQTVAPQAGPTQALPMLRAALRSNGDGSASATMSAVVPTGLPTGMDAVPSRPGIDPAPVLESLTLDSPPSSIFSAPPGTEVWQDELSAQLAVMSGQGDEAQAVMKLAPPELGEMEIRLEVRDGDATLQFVAASSEVRQALEQAQPRLRELFAQQGMGLSNFSVSNGLSRDPRSDSQDGRSSSRSPARGRESLTELRVRLTRNAPKGMLDLYA